MPAYRRVFGLEFITTCTYRDRQLAKWRAWDLTELTAENSICTTLKQTG
jgi:hypothetical protein